MSKVLQANLWRLSFKFFGIARLANIVSFPLPIDRNTRSEGGTSVASNEVVGEPNPTAVNYIVSCSVSPFVQMFKT